MEGLRELDNILPDKKINIAEELPEVISRARPSASASPALSVAQLEAQQSPETQRRRISNRKYEDEWEGCCSRTNRHYLKYMTQIAMGACVMVFSMAQIAREAPNREIYFSMLTGTLGLFLPHPQIQPSV